MAQYNISPPDYPRETGVGTVLAVLLVLALVAFLVWALAFGGFNALTGAPAPGSTNVSPNVNVNPGGAGSTSPSGGTMAPSGGTTGSSAPAKP